MTAAVAAACAMTAGWIRIVGQVTAVVTVIESVAWAIGDPEAFESGLLRFDRLPDEVVWTPLLARQEVADLHVAADAPPIGVVIRRFG
jgi:hypothetical protein